MLYPTCFVASLWFRGGLSAWRSISIIICSFVLNVAHEECEDAGKWPLNFLTVMKLLK